MNKRILLPWLFFIIFSAQLLLLSSLAIQNTHPQSKQTGLGHPKNLLIQQQEVHGYSNTTISSHHGDGKGGENEMLVDSSKFTKGKGPYGGANVARHPSPKNTAESLSKTPYIIYIHISAAITFYVSFVLLLVPSF